ncbi:15088_t:CDS:1, partial [Funneliformis geosporum]
ENKRLKQHENLQENREALRISSELKEMLQKSDEQLKNSTRSSKL